MMIFFQKKVFYWVVKVRFQYFLRSIVVLPREYFSTCLKVLQYFLWSTEMG